MALRFHILGQPEMRGAAGPVLIPQPRQSTLFTALAVSANTPVPLDRLASALWPEPDPAAIRQVRTEVSALRECLHGVPGEDGQSERLLWRRDGYLLSAVEEEIDLDRFTLLYRQGRAALDADDHWAAAYLLGQALALWRGAAGTGCETFGWLRGQLAKINELRWSAAEGRLVALLNLGRRIQAVAEARDMLALDPQHAPWWACLIAGLRDSGESAAARKTHNRARQTFIEEYGVLPNQVRQMFHAALLPRQPRSDTWVYRDSAASDSCNSPDRIFDRISHP